MHGTGGLTMSILIKGIEMPKEPWDCPCHNGENGRCNITQNTCFEIPKDCPLVEVQTPHGKLVDTNDVKKSFLYRQGDIFTAFHFYHAIDSAPTIIESEE